jgi:hypothetical protein
MCKCDALGHHRSLFARCKFLNKHEYLPVSERGGYWPEVGSELLPLQTRIQFWPYGESPARQRHTVDL